MPIYDEKAVADAQASWRKQDMKTWEKWDAESVAKRHDSLIDLLSAHIPIADKEGG